jgi:hypothetical protein
VELSVDEPAFSREFFWSPWGTAAAYPSVSLDNQDARLTMQETRADAPIEVSRDAWAFARWENGQLVPDPTSVYLKGGFKPGWLYDLVYTARDPRVSGLGMVCIRDGVSFFRRAAQDAAGTPNPLRDVIDYAYCFGISQSGRLIHHFLFEALNADIDNRPVFDGVISHVPGAGKGLFNARFGMATVYGLQHRNNLFPVDDFPFSSVTQTDPLTGRTASTFDRLRAADVVPKSFFVQTATEYWTRAASLLHTSVTGETSLVLDESVRIYHIAGAQHLGATPTDPGLCQYPRSPLRHRPPVLRALLVAMDRWVAHDTPPPDNRYPHTSDDSLVDLATFSEQFPKIPGVALPTAYYQPVRLDAGPQWYSDGIATVVPPKVGPPYKTLIPAVDADGNEVGAIRLPDVAVPLATYMGWNLRREESGAGGMLADLHGAFLEFPRTAEERQATGDPRPSIRERYPTREVYLTQYTDAVLGLQEDGFLLPQDAVALLKEAAGRDLWSD